MWYILSTEKPNFLSSDKPDVEDITSSTVTVNWPKANQMTPGLEGKYYHYILWLKADGEKEKNVTMVPQDGAKHRMDSDLTRLRFNTYYTVRVQPYREHNGDRDLGTATEVIRFKTNCTGELLHSFNKYYYYNQQDGNMIVFSIQMISQTNGNKSIYIIFIVS